MFDGNNKSDVINKITLDYHRVTKIKQDKRPEGETWACVTRDYTGHLMIDRETEMLEHIQNIGTGCKVSRKYEIEGGIESLLENFDEGYKSYYYLTDDDSSEVGDFVLVLAGKDNHEAVVEVVNIEYFSEENVLLPIEKIKRIIRKCKDEDFDLPESE